jgi:hypothetical protein
MVSMTELDEQKDTAITRYLHSVTIPLLGDSPEAPIILGTGTLFCHEARHFIVTAAHILKADEDDLASADIDMKTVSIPTGRYKGGLVTLGSINVFRPNSGDEIDVCVIELTTADVVSALRVEWNFLDFAQVAPMTPGGHPFDLAASSRCLPTAADEDSESRTS